MTKEEYREYLNTAHWKQVRNDIYKKRKKICYCCQKEINRLEVHHKTYERIGKERRGDLVLVCPACHEEIHQIYQKNKNIRGINLSKITIRLREHKFRQKVRAYPKPYSPKKPAGRKIKKKWYSKINVFSPKEIVEYKKKLAETT